MKKFSSLFLAILMVLSLPIFTFSSTVDTETSNASLTYKSQKFNIKLMSDNHIEVSSKDGVEQITVTENSTTKKATIYNVNSGQTSYLLLNKKTGSIYSSLTNKTIEVPINEEAKSPLYRPEDVSLYSFPISYAKIRSALGASATASGILSFILFFVPGGQPYSEIFGKLSSILKGLSYVVPNDKHRGIRVYIKQVKHYRSRAGQRRLYKVSKFITNVHTIRIP